MRFVILLTFAIQICVLSVAEGKTLVDIISLNPKTSIVLIEYEGNKYTFEVDNDKLESELPNIQRKLKQLIERDRKW